jgi:hypothetical protein
MTTLVLISTTPPSMDRMISSYQKMIFLQNRMVLITRLNPLYPLRGSSAQTVGLLSDLKHVSMIRSPCL